MYMNIRIEAGPFKEHELLSYKKAIEVLGLSDSQVTKLVAKKYLRLAYFGTELFVIKESVNDLFIAIKNDPDFIAKTLPPSRKKRK